MVCGLHKFAGEVVRQRASSPKLQVLNHGLKSAQAPRRSRSFVKTRSYGAGQSSRPWAHISPARRKRENWKSTTGARFPGK